MELSYLYYIITSSEHRFQRRYEILCKAQNHFCCYWCHNLVKDRSKNGQEKIHNFIVNKNF